MYDGTHLNMIQKIYKSLHANFLLEKDVDYIIRKGKIELVDKSTGRVMEGRKFSEGLHQSIEAKEGVDITDVSRSQAQITYQTYLICIKLYRE